MIYFKFLGKLEWIYYETGSDVVRVSSHVVCFLLQTVPLTHSLAQMSQWIPLIPHVNASPTKKSWHFLRNPWNGFTLLFPLVAASVKIASSLSKMQVATSLEIYMCIIIFQNTGPEKLISDNFRSFNHLKHKHDKLMITVWFFCPWVMLSCLIWMLLKKIWFWEKENTWKFTLCESVCFLWFNF